MTLLGNTEGILNRLLEFYNFISYQVWQSFKKFEKYDNYPYIYQIAWEINHYVSSPVLRCCTPSPSQPRLWPTLPVSLNLTILNLVFIFPCISHKYSAGCFFMVHSFLEIFEDLKFILCVHVHVVCTYYVGFRWQLAGASSLLVPRMFWGLHSSHQARRQALLPTEPSPQAKCSSYKSINSILPQLAFPLPAASVRSTRVGACRGTP